MKPEIKKGFLILMLMAGLISIVWTGVSLAEIRLAVAPFEMEPIEEKTIIPCRYCGNIMETGPIEGEPVPLLTHWLWDLILEKEKGFDLISPSQVEGFYSIFLAKGKWIDDKDPLRLIKAMGHEMKADYVLWGNVFRFQERQGTSYGVRQPASVAFDLHLMRVKDGKLIWRAQWARTQKSLSENLLEINSFVKDKMRWVTAEELSIQGLKKMLKDFPPAESLK
jgi:hypothetical protein